MQDSFRALQVRLSDSQPDLKVNDWVEAIGYAQPNEFAPVMVGANLRHIARAEQILPVPFDVKGILEQSPEARLIEVDAALTDRVHVEGDELLVRHSGHSLSFQPCYLK